MGSPLGKFNLNDLLHGLIVAVATSVLTVFMQMLSAGHVDWKQLGLATISATIAYILKILASDEDGKIGGKV